MPEIEQVLESRIQWNIYGLKVHANNKVNGVTVKTALFCKAVDEAIKMEQENYRFIAIFEDDIKMDFFADLSLELHHRNQQAK